jgi:hypothetical protein
MMVAAGGGSFQLCSRVRTGRKSSLLRSDVSIRSIGLSGYGLRSPPRIRWYAGRKRWSSSRQCRTCQSASLPTIEREVRKFGARVVVDFRAAMSQARWLGRFFRTRYK